MAMVPSQLCFSLLILAGLGKSVCAVRTRRGVASDSPNVTGKPPLLLSFEAVVSTNSQSFLLSANESRLKIALENLGPQPNATGARASSSHSADGPRDRTLLDIAGRLMYNHERFFDETVCFQFDMHSNPGAFALMGRARSDPNATERDHDANMSGGANDSNQSSSKHSKFERMLFLSAMSELFGAPLELYQEAEASWNRSVAGLNCTAWTVNKSRTMSMADMLQAMQALAGTGAVFPAWMPRPAVASAAAVVEQQKAVLTAGPTPSATMTDFFEFCVTESGEMLETSMRSKVTVQKEVNRHRNASSLHDKAENNSNDSMFESVTVFDVSSRTSVTEMLRRSTNPTVFNATHGVTGGECVDLTQGSVGPSELHAGLNSVGRLARINTEASGHWEAGTYEFWDGLTVDELVPSLGTQMGPLRLPLRPLHPHTSARTSLLKQHSEDDVSSDLHEEIPESFDAREHWPTCNSISMIRNQGPCGSCWAVAAATVISDRFCVAATKLSGGIRVNRSAAGSNASLLQLADLQALSLAPEQMVDCDGTNNGCGGGRLDDAWIYLRDHGVPQESCSPYRFCPVPTKKECSYGRSNRHASRFKEAPKCDGLCKNGSPMNLFRVSSAYSAARPRDIAALQREVLKSGPVEVAFFVFSDFLSYKRGVYFRTPGAYGPLGGHAVRLLGWGAQEEFKKKPVDYWLIANSYSSSWGMNGLFRIRRGTNECGIETTPAAGLPQLDNLFSQDHPASAE